MSKWKRVKLKDISAVITKGTTPSNIGASFAESGIPYIKSEYLTFSDKYIVPTEPCFISAETHEKLKRSQLCSQDILLSMAGAYLGKSAILRDEDVPANTNQAVALIRIDSNQACPDYVYYFLNQKQLIAFMNQLPNQSAQPNINLAQIGSLEVGLPEIEAQKRTAGILSSYDKLIENNCRQIALLEETAQRLYKEWFVDLRFPGYETEPIIDGLPEGWRKGKLDEIVEFRRGKTITQNETLDGDVPVVAGGLKPAYYHTHANTTSPVITVSGSGANAGFCRLYTTEIWASDCSFADSSMTDNLYFAYASIKVLSNGFKQCQRGSAQPHVYPKHVNALDVVIPDGVCLSAFNDVAKALYSQIGILNERVSAAREARDRLLPKLMSGEIEVG